MATLSTGGTTSATLVLDAFAGVSVACDASVQGTLTFVSAAPNLRSNFTAKIQNKTYGPWGVPGTLTLSVTAGSATYTVVNVGAGSVSGLSFDITTAAATANTTAIQAALTAGGLVQITTPGVYYYTRADNYTCWYMDDNTELRLGAGVNLVRISSGTGSSIIVNRNWRSNAVRISSISDTAGSITNTRLVTVNTVTAHGRTTGQYVQIKGDTTRAYLDIYQITVTSTTQFTFVVWASTALGAGGGNMYMYPANYNCRITGPGLIDGGNVAAGAGSENQNQTMGIIFNKCKKWFVGDGIQIKGQPKYLLYYSNSFDGLIDKARFDNGSNGPQGIGPIYNQKLKNIEITCADDPFAVTVTSAGFTDYDMRDAGQAATSASSTTISGITDTSVFAVGQYVSAYRVDTGASAFASGVNVTVATISANSITISRATNYTGAVNLYPVSSEGEIIGLEVDGQYIAKTGTGRLLLGTGSAGIITNVSFKNITGNCWFGPIIENLANAGAGTIGSVRYDNVTPRYAVDSYFLNGGTISTSVAIDYLSIGNAEAGDLFIGASTGFSGIFVNVPANVTISSLSLDRLLIKNDATNGSTGGALLSVSGGTVTQANLTNIGYIGTGSTRGFNGVITGTTGTLTDCFISNVKWVGNTASNLITHGATGSITNYFLTNARLSGANMVVSAGASCNLMHGNVKISGMTTGYMQLTGTTQTYGIQFNTMDFGGHNVLQSTGTSCIYNITANGMRNFNVRFNNSAGTTNTFNVEASDGSLVLKSDFAATFNVTSGAMFYDVKAAVPGLYAKGPTALTGLAVT